MNKFLKGSVCVLMCGVFALSFTGCRNEETPPGPDVNNPDKTYQNDPETRPVVFSIGALDNNFNPFFYTSANDGEVAGMTQISMLSSDKDGNPVCGEDQPTVVLDYSSTMYNANGVPTTTGDMNGTTEYEFVIKNGIKFSDGVDLTIDDVLFNLYVYLDPAYMGSSTIYSTDIQGLKAYRAQDPDLTDDSDTDYSSGFYATAAQRVYNVIAHVENPRENPVTQQITADIATVKSLFHEEVTSDWTSNYGTLSSYENEYSFTEDWQVYYLNEGIIQVQTELNENGATVKLKDANGKYLTSLNDPDNTLTAEMESQKNDQAKIKEYQAANGNCTVEQAQEYIMRDVAIQTVYESYTTLDSQLADILRYWATASNALDKFAAEARTEYYNNTLVNGQLKVKNISGITTYKTSTFKGESLGEEHDVLKIVINGVDPKAIWNFAFTVAPMHYYSNSEQTALAKNDGGANDTYFGVKFADADFFQDVLQAVEKNGLPVGAGVYKASSIDGTNVTKDTFSSNNFVYYERNTYFETVGKELHNAKIRKFIYKVVGEDKILNSLITKEIDYGTPGATEKNINSIASYTEYLSHKMYQTGGYGYVGVNPKFVPDLAVRQAIMKAMNTSSIVRNYYTGGLAETIYRPMSKTSWAYPESASEYPSIKYTTSVTEIQALVESAGWRKSSVKNDRGVEIYAKDGKQLKITFTLAGETTDHPAYDMFCDAEIFLEDCGFDITVQTDIQALRKLATGDLAVWAAAWSSGIDPDMYQIYHKDSTATSVNNWNYKNILNDTEGIFTYERGIIEELSTVIEEARQTLNQDTRAARYAEALDLVMDLAVELPTYQRNDLVVFNSKVIDVTSLNANPSWTEGVISKLWELDYV